MRFRISLSQVVPLSLALSTLAIAGYAVVQGSLAVLIAYLLFGLTGLVLVWRGGWDSIEETQMFATKRLWLYNHERSNMALGGIAPQQKLAMEA